MNLSNYQDFKITINAQCLKIVGDRLTTIRDNMDTLMDAKRNETKSSAGDKYETGIAMIQNEEALYSSQHAMTIKILDQLLSIDPDVACNKVTYGALVLLPSGWFYISTGMGKLVIDDQECFAISLDSPLGQELKGKKAGDSFKFQQREQVILNIY
jgi:hypothetical protein